MHFRNLAFLTLALVVLIFASCKKDDDGNNNQTQGVCDTPTNLNVQNVTSTDALLTWMASAGATSYIVEYGISGFTQGNGTTRTSVDTFLQLSNLTPDTDYEFYVAQICGNNNPADTSGFAGPMDFITLSPPCDSTGTPFQILADELVNNQSYTDDVWMDLETHEYTFELSQNGYICAIGYQSQNGYTGSYGIEISDANTVIYTGTHTFSGTATQFITINPVLINAGDTYTIRRTILTPVSPVDVLGRGLRIPGNNVPYPVSYGYLTITASSFYGGGGPVNDIVIPYIDFSFIVQ